MFFYPSAFVSLRRILKISYKLAARCLLTYEILEVPEAGLEPACSCERRALNTVCLPIPPLRLSRPDANRTRNPQLRRLMLYPIELRAQDFTYHIYFKERLSRQAHLHFFFGYYSLGLTKK